MRGVGRLKLVARSAISTHRRSLAVRALHSLASFVESAYANEGANFHLNGEQTLLRKLAPADFRLAFDVGANFGDWSAEAMAMWPHCNVHAFEVAPQTFQRLGERLRATGDNPRVTLNCLGLSDELGTRQMFYYPDHPDVTADVHWHTDLVSIPFEAHLATGDTYCHERGIDTLDFLKIDVEGAEYRVMKGFGERLAAQKVHCVQFEYGAFSTQTKVLLADYHRLLSQLYWIGKIFPTYVDFRDYQWTMEDFRFSNYCCVSKLRPDLRNLLAA
jgi:FkbM family methyltransferase